MHSKTAADAFVNELFKIAVSKQDHKLYALLLENQEALVKEANLLSWAAGLGRAGTAGKATKTLLQEAKATRAANQAVVDDLIKLEKQVSARAAANPASVNSAQAKALKDFSEAVKKAKNPEDIARLATQAKEMGITAETAAARGYEPIRGGFGGWRDQRALGMEYAAQAPAAELSLLRQGGAPIDMSASAGGRQAAAALRGATRHDKSMAALYYNIPVNKVQGHHVMGLTQARKVAENAGQGAGRLSASPSAVSETVTKAPRPEARELPQLIRSEQETMLREGARARTPGTPQQIAEAEAIQGTRGIPGEAPPVTQAVPDEGAGFAMPDWLKSGPVPVGMGVGAVGGGGLGLATAEPGDGVGGLVSGAIGGAMLGGVAGAGVRAAGGMTKLKDMFKATPPPAATAQAPVATGAQRFTPAPQAPQPLQLAPV